MDSNIAVVIPAYNCARYLRLTLQSVINQTIKPSEIIVVDDGSTDDTASALAPYRNVIKIIRQANAGTSAARNAGIAAARAAFVVFLDGDDILMPDALENHLQTMKDTHADVVYGDYVFMGGYHDGQRFMDLFPSCGAVTLSNVLARQCNVTASVLAKREALLGVGGFAVAVKHAEDLDMWVRMLAAGYSFAYHRNVVVKYRREGQGKSSGAFRNAIGDALLYCRFLRLGLTSQQVTIVLQRILRLGLDAALIGGKAAVPHSVKGLLKGLQHRPTTVS